MKLRKHAWLYLVLALVLAGAMMAVAACGGDEETTTTTAASGGGTETTAAPTETTAAPTETTVAEGTPTPGGTFRMAMTADPTSIDPVNSQESEGMEVTQALFDSLVTYDAVTQELIPAVAESWEPNADASVWTFHLGNSVFHNGRAVTAADFKYAWERICDPDGDPASGIVSEISYHLSPIKGYAAMQDGTATELEGVKAIDEKTLEVTLEYPFGDFEYVVGHPSLAPVPKEEVEKDPKAFFEKPIGNGPFMMAEPWAHDQYIKLVKFDQYGGADKPLIDGIDMTIFQDEETAFLEFRAGNLDYADVPSGQMKAVQAEFGISDDGITVTPGKQVLNGPETATYYLVLNNNDEFLKNADLRRALSLAINRQAIADTVYEGVRQPATGIAPEGVAGYQDGQWAYAKYDVEQAKALLEKAGFPGGQGLPEVRIGFNSGAGHEDVMALVQADFAAIGVKSVLEGVEWAQWLDQMDAGDFMVGRLGWIADYPIIDNFLYPLFQSKSLDNHSFFANPEVDKALLTARSTGDTAARIAAYQALEKQIGEAAPVIPIVKYRHKQVGSDRIRDYHYSAMGLSDWTHVWIAQ